MRKPLTLAVQMLLCLLLSIHAEAGIELSFATEYAGYSNDYDMGPSFVYSTRLAQADAGSKSLALQFSYSKLPYFTVGSPHRYRDQVSWVALSVLRRLSFRADAFQISVYPRLGLVYQSTWHDDLVYGNDFEECFGCGDYALSSGYLDYEIHAEVEYLFTPRMSCGIGLAYRGFLGPQGMNLDTHNAPRLGKMTSIYASLKRNF